MTYEEKIQAAKAAISEHNVKQVSEGTQVDADAFINKLVADGGVDDETLKGCSFEDLEGYGLPKLLAKKVAGIFRQQSEAEEGKKQYVSAKRAERMTIAELLAVYDPRDPENPVGRELTQRSKGKKCIVFNASGSVNVEISEKLFNEIRDGFDERETYLVDSKPHKVYTVGKRPDMLADENPLYPKRRLRPDGTCDQTNRSWDGVPYPVKAILYLAVTETGEVHVSHDTVHNIIDLALSEGAEKKVRERYARASVRYDELEAQGALPSLKVTMNGSDGAVGGGRVNNPFGNREY